MFDTLAKKGNELTLMDLLIFMNDQFIILHEDLTQIRKEIHTMAIDQATFDTDLAALVAAVGTLVTAVDAFIAAHPATDLTPEDQAVATAAQSVADELSKLTPAP